MKTLSYKDLEKEIKKLKGKQKDIIYESLRSLHSQSSIPTIIVNKKGEYIEYNQAMAELTGYSREEVSFAEEWLLKLYPDEEHRNSFMIFMEKSLHQKRTEAHRDEFIITRKDSTHRHVAFSVYTPLHDENAGDVRILQGIDITDSKKAELALRESEERHLILSNITSDYYYSLKIEPDGQINTEWESGSFQSITGYSQSEIHNLEKWLENIHPDEVEIIRKNTQAVLANQPVESQYRFFTKQGTIRWLCDRLYPVWDEEEQRVVRILGAVKDITELKKIEEEKEKHLYDLEKRVKELNCLYKLSKLLEQRPITLEKIFQETIHLILSSFQYPDSMSARLVFEDKEFKTDNFLETRWKLSAAIKVKGKPAGLLEACYLNEKPVSNEDPFLKEEHHLIDAVVERLGMVIERKRAIEALKMSEDKYRTLTENTNDIVFSLNTEGILNYIGPQIAYYGFKPEEIICQNFQDFILPEDRRRMTLDFQKSITTGEEFLTEFRIMDKKEIIHWLEENGKIQRDVSGNITGITGILRDITKRKKMEQALEENEEMFRNLSEQSPNMIYVNRMGRVVYANKICGKLLGYTNDELYSPDFDFFTLIAPESGNLVKNNFRRHMNGEEVAPYEYTLISREGKRIEVIGATKLIKYYGKTAILGIITDITEHKKADEKLKRTQKELEIKTKNLEESNIALKVLLKHQNKEKNILEKNMVINLETLVVPYLEKIRMAASDERQKTYVTIIETNLSEITKPFASQLSKDFTKLTPTEIQIANLIKENKSSKDIADILSISETTVFSHRRHIREKLGLKSEKTNLQSYLRSLVHNE